MATTTDPIQSDPLIKSLRRRLRRTFVAVLVLAVLTVTLIACLAFTLWKGRAMEARIHDLEFSQFVTDYDSETDFVMPQVNTIQFLRRGYSITFDTVQYTQEGLDLNGTIGNPTELLITSLALNFTARPYPYKVRNKWDVGGDAFGGFIPWWNSDWDIGSGQTTVGVLNPGASAPFHVTIPNVKQTADSIQIAVAFSGERYSYLK